jgi:hypothetical protein
LRGISSASLGSNVPISNSSCANWKLRPRETIARSLHDGYLQALAAVNLRLEGCRDMLIGNELEPALAEIKEIQPGVTREYDEVQECVRSLAGADQSAIGVDHTDLNALPRSGSVYRSRRSCRAYHADCS